MRAAGVAWCIVLHPSLINPSWDCKSSKCFAVGRTLLQTWLASADELPCNASGSHFSLNATRPGITTCRRGVGQDWDTRGALQSGSLEDVRHIIDAEMILGQHTHAVRSTIGQLRLVCPVDW